MPDVRQELGEVLPDRQGGHERRFTADCAAGNILSARCDRGFRAGVMTILGRRAILLVALFANACATLRAPSSFLPTHGDCHANALCEAWFEEGQSVLPWPQTLRAGDYDQTIALLMLDGEPNWSLYLALGRMGRWTYVRCLEYGECSKRERLQVDWTPQQSDDFHEVFDETPIGDLKSIGGSAHDPVVLVRRCQANKKPICDSGFFPRGGIAAVVLLPSLWTDPVASP